MRIQERHLTDRELVLCLDGELPPSRKVAVDSHLAVCDTCRTRKEAIRETALAVSSAYRVEAPDEVVQERARARLEAALASGAHDAARPPSVIEWVLAAPRHALTAGAGVAVVVLVVVSLGTWVVARGPGNASPVAHLGVLPVASLTPGATWAVTSGELCAGTRHTRAISANMRDEVLAAYHMGAIPETQYELDYLITPELGGATDTRNLWPQAYASPVWNARVKDELERLLPRLVCNGELPLDIAQRDMAVDWIAAYKKYFRTDRPLQAHRGPSAEDDDGIFVLADARPAPAVQLVSLSLSRDR
jgi:hypothetical protein